MLRVQRRLWLAQLVVPAAAITTAIVVSVAAWTTWQRTSRRRRSESPFRRGSARLGRRFGY
ncbi:hypothetical protein I546_6543 [Mycobacterium kansasii 732]|nr:hypothetical protein I546_6543 [Mycobacterium kansasii 732]